LASTDVVAARLPGGAALDSGRVDPEGVLAIQARGMELSLEGMSVLEGDTYRWMNHAHAAMYGWDPAALIGRTWRELYTPAMQQWIESAVFPQLTRDGRWNGEIVGLKRDGSAVDIELSLSFADGTNRCARWTRPTRGCSTRTG
jgi:PAS domain S-box-containing protein